MDVIAGCAFPLLSLPIGEILAISLIFILSFLSLGHQTELELGVGSIITGSDSLLFPNFKYNLRNMKVDMARINFGSNRFIGCSAGIELVLSSYTEVSAPLDILVIRFVPFVRFKLDFKLGCPHLPSSTRKSSS
jgi:hypothetical protein